MTNDDVHTITAAETAASEWNPLESLEDVTRPLKVSGGRATVTLRKWSGRERLAYEDALTQRMLVKKARRDGEEPGEDDEDTVAIGTLRLYAASLTVRRSTGFPPATDGRSFLSGTREQVEGDLLTITHGETYSEILRLALEVQPLPKAVSSDEDEDGDDGDDPSRTPPTQQEAAAGVELESGSPVE